MKDKITTIADLEALYDSASPNSIAKVAQHTTPEYRAWIMASKFCILSTVGPDGTDASPRGDAGPVVDEYCEHTLLMPDWRGNNRLDSLRNIVSDPRVSLMFFVPKKNIVIRINGQAYISTNVDLIARFDRKGVSPRTVIVIKLHEVYSQCARALLRSNLWGDDTEHDLPSMGDILAAQTQGAAGGKGYDKEWDKRAIKTLWG